MSQHLTDHTKSHNFLYNILLAQVPSLYTFNTDWVKLLSCNIMLQLLCCSWYSLLWWQIQSYGPHWSVGGIWYIYLKKRLFFGLLFFGVDWFGGSLALCQFSIWYTYDSLSLILINHCIYYGVEHQRKYNSDRYYHTRDLLTVSFLEIYYTDILDSVQECCKTHCYLCLLLPLYTMPNLNQTLTFCLSFALNSCRKQHLFCFVW